MTNDAATILIVDDEIQNRKLLEALLKPEGYSTLSVANGEEALALIALRAPDLILLDLMMPGMNGYQIATILKSDPATVNIPIIMVTAQIDRNSRLAGLNAGAEDFLTKPVDRAELWLRVRNLLRLKAYGDYLQNHSRVLEEHVQTRTVNLRDSELRFRQMAENIRDVFFLHEIEGNRLLYVSPVYEEIWLSSCDSLYKNPQAWAKAIHPDDRALIDEKYPQGIMAGKSEFDCRIVRTDGSIRWINLRGFPIHGADGKVVRIASVAQDITESKAANDRIVYLNRLLAVLSGINTLIVRVVTREDLFRESCRIAIEQGGFRMAWIGIVDQSVMKIIPVASSGVDKDYFSTLKDLYSSGPGALQGNTMAAQTIRESKVVVSNDLENDPRNIYARRHATSGVCSVAMLPLIVSGKAVGVLALYATEIEFFHKEEINLLAELAGDIAFAIDHISKQERLDYLAFYDALTGLPNRGLFHDRLSHNLPGHKSRRESLAVVLLDIERFRRVNETLGRECGDQLLQEIGSRLQRVNDTVARIGVDMFGLKLRDARTPGEVNRALEIIITTCFTEPFALGDKELLRVACRVGIALYPDDGVDADSLLRNAEAALRRSKRSGDHRVFYAPEMNARVAESLAIETRLRRAIDRHEFVLHYQPKISLTNGRLTGVEALIRWQDPDKGLIPPNDFIPILEETGMIIEVGRWVVEQAFVDMHSWSVRGISVPRVAVNVSAIQLQNKNFVDEMIKEIRRGSNLPEWLELEITESAVMHDVENSIHKLSILRGMGVTIAIDDFGTGYSSLSYLSRLPLDSLKIDQSFVSGLTGTGDATPIVSTIISLAHSLKLKVVGEGVETDEQSNTLKLLGCDEAQGYLFSKPVSSEIFETKYPAPILIE